MDHAHDGRRTADKESAPPARKNVPKRAPSGAGGMLDLQRAAGNRAVTKMLTGPTVRRAAPRRVQDPSSQPSIPVSLQRDKLDAAIEYVSGTVNFDYRSFAQKILAPPTTPTSQGLTQRPVTPIQRPSGQAGTATQAGTVGATPEAVDWSIPSAEDLAARERRLKGTLSPKEKARVAKKEELDLLEATKNREKSLEERAKKLKLGESDEERALREREEDLTRQEEEQKLEEREKKVKHIETPEERSRREREEEVSRQEALKSQKAELEKRERELKHELTPEEKDLRAKKQELDDLEADRKADQDKAEETRQTRRKAAKARQSLKRVDWSKVPGNSRF